MSIELIESPQVALRTLEVPALGAPWPEQGGVYAGLVRGEGGAMHHLIVSTDPAGSFEDQTWGEYGKDITGATSKFEGLPNTSAMADAGNEVAKAVRALNIGGFTDWHIGSQADMHVAFANCAELFEKNEWYWSSTQTSRNDAFAQDFEYGGSGWLHEGDEFRVRAFRTIQLQPLNASALHGA